MSYAGDHVFGFPIEPGSKAYYELHPWENLDLKSENLNSKDEVNNAENLKSLYGNRQESVQSNGGGVLMNLYEKLSIVQSKLKAPKSNYNSFGKYNYRSCEDVLNAIKPLLAEVKAIVTLTDEIIHIEGRFYIKATAIFTDGEGKIEVSALAREDETLKGMSASQVTGSVSSYARKYALNGLFCIDDTKDSDATNTHGKGENKPTETPTNNKDTKTSNITEKQVGRLLAIAKSKGYTAAEVKTAIIKKYGVTEIAQLSKEIYDHIVAGYESAPVKGVK